MILGLFAAAAALAPADARALDCAAAFAVVAVLQTRDDPAVRALPPIERRGRVYFGQAAARIAANTGLGVQAVHDLLATAAQRLGPARAPAMAQSCLVDLDAAVAPVPPPDALACRALLEAYADALVRRDAADPLVADLMRAAARLAPAADGAALDAARRRQRDAPGDAEAYRTCRRMAEQRAG